MGRAGAAGRGGFFFGRSGEPDVLPEDAPDEDELPELEELEDELLLDVLELDDSLLTVKDSVLLFTVQSL